MRPNLPFLSAASNALLKPGGLLRWKKRLVKDARLLLPLTEVMKIASLTPPLLGVPRQSSLRPRLRHGRRLALLFHLGLTLNLCTLFFALSLALLPRLPPLLTFLTVLLPGNWLRSMPLTRDRTFPFLSQRRCAAEPEATSLSFAEPRARFGPVLFSLFINDLPAFLPSSVSCSLYADDLVIWSSSPSVHTAVDATQGALFRLERWSEYWCLPLNPSKCEASFFSVDPHQANLHPNLFLLGSRLRFNPTPTFLGVTFDRTLSFTKHVSLLKARFFPRLKALRCISASFWAPLRSPSLFCTNLFFGSFSLTLHPDGFFS